MKSTNAKVEPIIMGIKRNHTKHMKDWECTLKICSVVGICIIKREGSPGSQERRRIWKHEYTCCTYIIDAC